jgi:hypothetical protein
MSRTRQYHKRQAKAIQRRRRTAAERLQRDHVQAQRAIKPSNRPATIVASRRQQKRGHTQPLAMNLGGR